MRFARLVLFGVAVLVVATLIALTLLSSAAVRDRLALASARWMLTDYAAAPDQSRAKFIGRKLLAAYLQHEALAEFRARHPLPPGGDVDRVEARLRQLKKIFLSDRIVAHQAASWPVVFVGVAYCDQVNAVAAETLASDFEKAQIFALVNRVTNVSPHTLGRVWSPQLSDWLYFDTFFAEPVVFLMKGGQPQILRGAASPEFLRLYAMVRDGYVMNEYRPGFAGHLLRQGRPVGVARRLCLGATENRRRCRGRCSRDLQHRGFGQ